jgi:hypothetical protein
MTPEQSVMHFLAKGLPEMIAKDLVTIAPMSPDAAEAFKKTLDLLRKVEAQ